MKHLTVVLMVLFPLIGLLWLYERDLDARLTERVAESQTELAAVVANTAQSGQPREAYQRFFLRIKSAIRWNEDFKPLIADLASEGLKIFLFDSFGKRVHLPGCTPGLIYASEQCFQLIRSQARTPGNRFSAKDSRLLETFFGNPESVDQIVETPGQLVSITNQRSGRLTGIFPFKGPRGRPLFLLGMVEPSQSSEFNLVQQSLNRTARKAGPAFQFGVRDFLDRKNPGMVPGSDAASLPPRISEPFAEFGSSSRFSQGERLYATAWANKRFLVFGSVPMPLRSDLELPGFRQGALLVGILIMLSGLSWTSGIMRVSLRFQILILFALTGFGGLATVLGFARGYLEVRQKSLVRQLHVDAEDILTKVDARFQAFLENQSARMRSIMGGFRNPDTDVPALIRKLSRFRGLGDNLSVNVFDEKGRSLFSHQPKAWSSLNRLLGSNLPRILSRIAQAGLQRHNCELGFAPGFAPPSPGNIEDALYQDLGIGFFHARGNIRPMDMGGCRLVAISDIAFDENRRAIGFLLITFENDCLENAFLARQRRMSSRQLAERGSMQRRPCEIWQLS
ncbi:MAG: hypothetical protein ACOYM3_30285 [Terrimicrobiaceae bacterium]